MSTNDKIAVIGMSGRFPGSNNIDEFWKNLIEGKETIKTLSDDELSKYEFNFHDLKENPNFVRKRGVLEDIDKFDAAFFGFTPKEAALTDPQHRVWLETAWDAFENAGIDPFSYEGAIGVYAGSFINTYMHNNILRDREKLENFIRLRSTDSFQLMTGNDGAFLPTKTAYKFNLKGPAINVQTACSTSLVAIIQACQSLFSYESDVCLAGGVCILTPQESGYLYQEGAIPSPDGHCRPFDKEAKGTVFSNGVGIVVLKRLEDALNDGDRIYSVVSGWGLNNDGSKKVSYTAPGKDGQAEAIMMAHKFAEIQPEDIGYIEAHGTGTKLGDPVEISALTKAFNGYGKKQFCGIGSIKSNIGHTDAAAGVASFIKSSLAVYHRQIPPSINFSEPNPYIDFSDSPFYVLTELKEWTEPRPLIIGVSSFGIGGTNSHVVIEEPPRPTLKEEPDMVWPQLITVSAKTETALTQRKKDLIHYVSTNQTPNLRELGSTLIFRRNHMPYRSFVAVSTMEQLTTSIDQFSDGKAEDSSSTLTFVFPGQGAQYVNMGKSLYDKLPEFRKVMQECFGQFKAETGMDLEDFVFATENLETAEQKLAQTQFTQPALFIIEYALAKVLVDLGIVPNNLIGHSIGEYAAACISGVFDLKTALKVVIKRGELMQSMPTGKMLAVRCSKEALLKLSSPLFEIAAENTGAACTISLKHGNLEEVKKLLESNEITSVTLNTSHAFHSEVFDSILDEFARYINQFRLRPPQIPFISCLTGEFITSDEATSGNYWANQLRHTVLFAKGISTICVNEDTFFLEVGPNTHLSSFVRVNKQVRNKARVISTLGKPDPHPDDLYKIVNAFGSLWNNGYSLPFKNIYSYKNAYHATLPSYPFERKRYWVDYFPQDTHLEGKPATISLEIEEAKTSSSSSEESSTIPEIRRMLSDQSGFAYEDIKPEVQFQSFGFDSLFFAQFARNLEKKYKVPIAFRQLIGELTNIHILADYIEQNTKKGRQGIHPDTIASNADNLLVVQPDGTETPLILVHGDNANNFFPRFFEGERPIYSFLHLGADGFKNPHKDTRKMANAYVERLLKIQPQGPYILCGFSYGGILAYEMATILQSRSQEVNKLIIIDTKNPSVKEPVRGFMAWLKAFASYKFRKRTMKLKYYHLFRIPVPVKIRSIAIIHNYHILCKHYKPSAYKGDLLLFKTIDNPSVHKYLGWDGLVGSIELAMLKGKHTELMKIEDNIEPLVSTIKAYLKK
jgi:acyl transferase domain-containing protein/pimeloyl-ACP methyl ester carboxylesterase